MSAAATSESLRALLEARRVGIVGATERADAPAGFVMRNLLANGFTGTILPVHPSAREVFGLKASPRLADLDERPDVVVIGIAANAAVDVLAEAAQLAVRAAVVLASGFAEAGAEGRALQARLASIANGTGMAVCGPNCLGLHVTSSGLALFSSRLSPNMASGAVAVISHSGAGAIALANCGRFGVSHIISAGNAAVTDAADYISYLATSHAARVVALQLEQIADPGRFAQAMAGAHDAGLHVVALHAGRTARGAASTAAHTGALASSGEIWSAFLRRHGVMEARSADELVETVSLLSRHRAACSGGAIAMTGVSGGGLAQASDLLDDTSLALATLDASTLSELTAQLPPWVGARNPLDLTGLVFGEPHRYRAALDCLAADPGVAQIVALQDVPYGLDDDGAAEYAGIADAIIAHSAQAAAPAIVLTLQSGGLHPRIAQKFDDAGIAVVRGPPGVAALAHMLRPAARYTPQAFPCVAALPEWKVRLSQGPALTEVEAKAFLAAHGVDLPKSLLATTAGDAAQKAAEMGFPVVLKVVSPDIRHKTEAGGVVLGLTTPDGVEAAFTRILSSVHRHAPDARIEGVLVEEMIGDGVEAFVGVRREAPFGHAVIVGPGGVLVELGMRQALELAPIDEPAATRMIGQTPLGNLLAGFRGREAGDGPALAAMIARIAAVASAYGDLIDMLEINPVAVLAPGRGVRALDALVIRSLDSIAFSTGRKPA